MEKVRNFPNGVRKRLAAAILSLLPIVQVSAVTTVTLDYGKDSYFVKPLRGVWYDLNGDGLLDYVSGDGYSEKWTVWQNNGTGFSAKPLIMTDQGVDVNGTLITPGVYGAYASYATDINRDGITDLVCGIYLFLGQPDGTYVKGVDATEVTGNLSGQRAYLMGDINNDGANELLTGVAGSPTFNIFNKSVGYKASSPAAINDVNVVNEIDYYGLTRPTTPWWVTIYPDFFPKEPPKNEAARTKLQAIDLNGDGITDFMTDLEILLALGDGRYVQDQFDGKVTMRDFNGDGIVDYVLNNTKAKTISLFTVTDDGAAPKETKILQSLQANEIIFCYDVDKDGDVDIVVPVDGNPAYLILMDNQGGGKFRKKELLLEGSVEFVDCIDIDADGNYEVLYSLYDRESTNYILNYIKITGNKMSETPVKLMDNYQISISNSNLDKYQPYHSLCYNLFNDGLVYVLGPKSGEFTAYFDKKNQRPLPPANAPTIAYDGNYGKLHLQWGAGSDTETAKADLTYALRVGSAPGGADIVSPDALADGTRRNLYEGNMGYALQRVLDVTDWPAGKYYISVQAIDANHQGSKFSNEAVFEKKEDAIVVSYSHPFSVGDTCVVRCTRSDAEIDFGADAQLVEKADAEKGTYYVRYTTPGEKTIRPINFSASPKTVNVDLVAVHKGVVTTKSDYGIFPLYIDAVADLNGDGALEVNSSGFYKIGDDGYYQKIQKSWNLSLPDITAFADLDGDGVWDFISSGNYSWVYNYGDFDLDVQQQEAPFTSMGKYVWVDMNADGKLDCISSDKLQINNGDYLSFAEYELPFGYSSDCYLYDINNDGLPDVLVENVWLNNGDGTFSKQDDNSYPYAYDLDGDGKVDGVYSDRIVWGDGDVTMIEAGQGCSFVTDFNNDGYSDIFIDTRPSGSIITSYKGYLAVLCILPNHKVEMVYLNHESVGFQMSSPYKSPFLCDWLFKTKDGKWAFNYDASLSLDNTAPEAPQHLRANQLATGLNIEWDPAKDKESSPWQMKYNISVKRKGQEGPGSYVISPFNGGADGIPLPRPAYYPNSTRITIPYSVLPPGEYEIKVQAIDALFESGPFSETLNVVVTATAHVDMPLTTRVGLPTRIKLLANVDAKCDFADGEVVKQEGADYYVVWSTPGEKTVTVGTESTAIMVKEAPRAEFSIPTMAHRMDQVLISTDNYREGVWSYTHNGRTISVSDELSYVKMDYSGDRLKVTFLREGDFELVRTVTDEFGEVSANAIVEVLPMAKPKISQVSIDEATGLFAINGVELRDGDDSWNVYKESTETGKFHCVATGLLPTESFVDLSSNPAVSSARYYITGVTRNVCESAGSSIHQPIHLMINRGVNNGWNLAWSRYEGREVVSYEIFRGSSVGDMQSVAVLSGSLASYSDLAAPEGTLYYMVEAKFADDAAQRRAISMESSASGIVKSNVICTSDASDVKPVERMEIRSVGDATTLEGTGSTVQLIAYLYPANASWRNVNWTIEEGNEYASVSASGLVTAIGDNVSGRVVVRASAIDGSGVYAEIMLNYQSGISAATSAQKSEEVVCWPNPVSDVLRVANLPNDMTCMIVYNEAGVACLNVDMDEWHDNDSEELTIDVSKLIAGHYFIVGQSADGRLIHTRFIKR